MALNKQRKDPKTQLENAKPILDADAAFYKMKNDETQLLSILDIDPEQFEKLPTVGLKKKHITYRRIQKEFDLIGSTFLSQLPQVECEKKLKLVQLIHDYLITTDSANKTNSTVSAFSRGLHDWYSRSPAPDKTPNDHKKRLSINFIEAKDDGVEPGYKGYFNEAVFTFLYNAFPNDQQRWAVIKEHYADIGLIYEKYKDQIDIHIIKIVHKHIDGKYRITPEKEDLKRTKTILGWYEKRGEFVGDVATYFYQLHKKAPAIEKNIEAVLEVIGNDIARVAGLDVQEQSLYAGTYEANGILKLMLMAKWINNAKILNPLAGTLNHQFRVNDVVAPHAKIKFLSRNDIKDFAQYLPLFIIQGDNDAIGSRGQNKIIIDGKLIGIDFGHAYHHNILDKVRADFTINDESFKNYSVFHDSLRSDIVKGLLILARLRGDALSDEVINSYGQEFVQTINNITPKSDVKIFKDYILFFKELSLTFDGRNEVDLYNKSCCEEIVKKLSDVKIKAIDNARDKFIDTFSAYLHLPKQVVDLLQNIEKAMAGPQNTTLKSGDNNEVLLHHIQIIKANVTKWNAAVHNDQYTLTATFTTQENAENAKLTLLRYMNLNHSLFSLKVSGKSLAIVFNKQHIPALSKVLSEDRIKDRYHQADHTLYHHYVQESKLTEQLKTLASFGIDATLTMDVSRNNYQITFQKNGSPLDADITRLLQAHFKLSEADEKSFTLIPTQALNDAIKIITAIPFEIQREREIRAKHADFISISARLKAAQDLQRTSNDHFIFAIPTNWDENLIWIVKIKLKEFTLNEHHQFELSRTELSEFNEKLKQCWDVYVQLNINISTFSNEVNRLNQLLQLNIDKNMSLDITQQKDEIMLKVSMENINPMVAEILIKNGFDSVKSYKANDTSALKADVEAVIKSYTVLQTNISEQRQSFNEVAEGMKAQHGIEVSILEDNGDFIVSVTNDSTKPSLVELLKQTLSSHHCENGYFQFQHTDLSLLNSEFLMKSFLYGELKTKAANQAVIDQFSTLHNTMLNDESIGHALSIIVTELDNQTFALVIKNNDTKMNLVSLLPTSPNERGQHILTLTDLSSFNDNLARLYQLHKKEVHLANKTKALFTTIGKLNNSLARPHSFSLFAPAKQLWQGKTATATYISELLQPYLQIDNLETNQALSSLSEVILLRKNHLEALIKNYPQEQVKYEDELSMLKSISEESAELAQLRPKA